MNSAKKMYKKSLANGSMQVWQAWVEGDELHSLSGNLDGKMKPSVVKCKPKNTGKTNATTAEEQAMVELEAKYKSQEENKHYRSCMEAAERLADDCKIPQKVENYKDHSDKLPDDIYSSIKLNGSRACVLDGSLYSKVGRKEVVKVPHLKKLLNEMTGLFNTFDAEVYAHGLSLSRIRSAWLKPVKTSKEVIGIAKDRLDHLHDPRDKNHPIQNVDQAIASLGYNPNDDAALLKFHVFDIPVVDTTFEQRVVLLSMMKSYIEGRYSDCITVVLPNRMSKAEVPAYRDEVVSQGYEGLVHYDPKGCYKFGIRTYNTLKDKPRYSAEALVIGCNEAKNGSGTLTLRGGEELGGVLFNGVMKGDAALKNYHQQVKFIGQWVTIEYEDLSDKGVPQKIVVTESRLCDNNGNPLE